MAFALPESRLLTGVKGIKDPHGTKVLPSDTYTEDASDSMLRVELTDCLYFTVQAGLWFQGTTNTPATLALSLAYTNV